ncbi:hypothetical protein [Burkholderia anthina]|nr:hypothetical protein [Burkholderia anthina]
MFERNRYLLDQTDPELFDVIQQENRRREEHIALTRRFPVYL